MAIQPNSPAIKIAKHVDSERTAQQMMAMEDGWSSSLIILTSGYHSRVFSMQQPRLLQQSSPCMKLHWECLLDFLFTSILNSENKMVLACTLQYMAKTGHELWHKNTTVICKGRESKYNPLTFTNAPYHHHSTVINTLSGHQNGVVREKQTSHDQMME